MSADKKTRHGQRKPGKTATSISLREDIYELAKTAAEDEDRSLSNLIERELAAMLRKKGLLPDKSTSHSPPRD